MCWFSMYMSKESIHCTYSFRLYLQLSARKIVLVLVKVDVSHVKKDLKAYLIVAVSYIATNSL